LHHVDDHDETTVATQRLRAGEDHAHSDKGVDSHFGNIENNPPPVSVKQSSMRKIESEPHRETWRLGCMSYAAMGNSESFR
jgi:hypothetical protein